MKHDLDYWLKRTKRKSYEREAAKALARTFGTVKQRLEALPYRTREQEKALNRINDTLAKGA